MIKKRLLIIFCRPISKIAYHKYGINFFKKNFSTKVVDASPIIGSSSNNFKNNFTKIKDIKKFDLFLKKNEFDFYLDFLDRDFISFIIRYKIKRKKIPRIAISSLGMTPKKNYSEQRKTIFLNRMKLLTNPQMLFFKIKDYIIQFFFYKNMKPDVALAGGLISSPDFLNSKHKIFATSTDYSIYLKKRKKINIKKKYAVFTDIYLPFHPDQIQITKKYIKAKKYFKELSNFFNFFQKKTGLKIVIALHPRADIKRYPKEIKKFKIYQHLTNELIANSKLVMMHESTSKSFAVLYKKPVIYLETDSMRSIKHLYDYTSERVFIGAKLLNISNLNKLKLNKKNFLNFSKKRYREYTRNYLKHPKSSNKTWYEILYKFTKKTAV